MWFLIKSAFWLSIVLLLLPLDTGQGSSRQAAVSPIEAIVATGEAAGDIAGMCDRKPQVCAVGKSALETIGLRARAGARMAFEMLDEHFAHQASTAEAAAPAAVAD